MGVRHQIGPGDILGQLNLVATKTMIKMRHLRLVRKLNFMILSCDLKQWMSQISTISIQKFKLSSIKTRHSPHLSSARSEKPTRDCKRKIQSSDQQIAMCFSRKIREREPTRESCRLQASKKLGPLHQKA